MKININNNNINNNNININIMSIIQNIYYYFRSVFELLSFRRKPSYTSLSDIENPQDYEFIIFHDNAQ
jgi:hypothetical protein